MPRMSLTAGITERHLPVAISNDTSVFLFVAVHHSDGGTVSGLGKSDFVVRSLPPRKEFDFHFSQELPRPTE